LARPIEKDTISIVVSIQTSIQIPADNGSTLELWQAPDRVAADIGKFLAERICPDIVLNIRDPRLLRRIPDKRREEEFNPFREAFWTQAIEAKFRAARKEYE
jgi:hypothetical protein